MTERWMSQTEAMADYYDQMERAAEKGQCLPSGLPLPICRGSICDCFDHEDVEPASGEECTAYFGEPGPGPVDPEFYKALEASLDALKCDPSLACPNCGDGPMEERHQHQRCRGCGYIEPCCQGPV